MTVPGGEDPREVRVAHVLKDGVPAGTLTRGDGGVLFSYSTTYLQTGGRAVATTLPLTDEPVRTIGGAVPAFFANLLPEGRRLTALRRSVKTSADDELTLLLAVGSDPRRRRPGPRSPGGAGGPGAPRGRGRLRRPRLR